MHKMNSQVPKFAWSCLRRELISQGEGEATARTLHRLRYRTTGIYLMRLRQNYHHEGRNATFSRPVVGNGARDKFLRAAHK